MPTSDNESNSKELVVRKPEDLYDPDNLPSEIPLPLIDDDLSDPGDGEAWGDIE